MSRKPKSEPKKTRGSKAAGSSNRARGEATSTRHSKQEQICCYECKTVIEARDQALFVEEEVGRFFCTEGCIVAHFTPEIERLERDYGKYVSANDLNPQERERFAHLRWLTLEQPGEVWAEKTQAGDYRYTLVAEYIPDNSEGGPKKVWGVAVCLMLRQEPSFLYLAFVTSDKNLVDVFRRGAPLQMVHHDEAEESIAKAGDEEAVEGESGTEKPAESDRLADSWTEADSVRAQIIKNRKETDIQPEDFAFYQNCLEETLQEPSELWSFLPKAAKRVYHFIRRYEHDTPYWYVVIARDTSDETQIEIVDAFPTRDDNLVEACRHGKKEIMNGTPEAEAADAMDALASDPIKKNVH